MNKAFSFRRFACTVLLFAFILSTGIFLYVRQMNAALQSETISYLGEVAQQVPCAWKPKCMTIWTS